MNLNKTVKGICSVCVAAFLAFPIASIPNVFAGISDSGDCSAVNEGESNSVAWSIDATTLKITGSGKMADYDEANQAPWYSNDSTITAIEIEDGVTSIGNHAFCGLSNAQTITIPNSVERIGIDAFENAKCETAEANGFRYVGNWLTGFKSSEDSKTSEIEVKDGTTKTADFTSGKVDVKGVVLPKSLSYIGKNFLSGSSLKSVYIKTGEELNLNLTKFKNDAAQDVAFYCTIVNGESFKINGVNETATYHVGDRPSFNAELTDFGGTSPRLTLEEKWVNINESSDEITKQNNNVFRSGVTYKYIITVKLNSDKFNFEEPISADGKAIELNSAEPLVGTFTFKNNFKALISVDSVNVEKNESFDISCTSVGSQPKFAQSAGSDAKYSIVYEAWEKVNSSGEVEKRAVSGEYPSSETEVSALESFEENGLYKYTVCLKPNAGYYFNTNVITKLGGEIRPDSVKQENKVIINSATYGAVHAMPLTKKDKVDPTCTAPGNIEYYQCSKCSKLFADENAQNSLTSSETVLDVVEHTYEKVEAKEATCTQKGNIEYFKCSSCGKYFKSENGQPGEEITDIASVETEMIPHTFDETIFISDGENGHYHKCKYCDAHSAAEAHNFEESWSSDSEGHYHKCKDCGQKKDFAQHVFDKQVESEKYLKEGLTCGDVISYYKSCECGESSKGTENEETFENKEGKKIEHEFDEEGVCKICNETNYKVNPVNGGTYYQSENGSFVFRANGNISKFLKVKVDGNTLTKDKDYTIKAGSTIVELKSDYLKTLSAGNHTLEVIYEDGECETEFDVKADPASTDNDETENGKDEDGTGNLGNNVLSDIIYKTGDSSSLVALASTVLTSGLASIWFAKKRKKK